MLCYVPETFEIQGFQANSVFSGVTRFCPVFRLFLRPVSKMLAKSHRKDAGFELVRTMLCSTLSAKVVRNKQAPSFLQIAFRGLKQYVLI